MAETITKKNVAVLKIDGKEIELPLIVGSEGERAVDIQKLRAQTGYITLDPGYMNTGSCESAITFIDGEKGILRYRGIPIEEVSEKSEFLEVCYLLINGRLPKKAEYDKFIDLITRHTLIHEDMKRFYDGFPRDAHPMAILSSAVNTLSTFYQRGDGTPNYNELDIIRMLAKLPTIAALAYKKSIGQAPMYPCNKYGYAENFLHMMFGLPSMEYEVDPTAAKALDLLFILHADHEQNCSTSTVRLVGSSKANIFTSISAGISALWGPLHGGANQAVLEMLQDIHNGGGDVKKFVQKAKDGQGDRLMGFGHRVYKNFDPRAKIIKKAADDVLAKLGVRDPLLDIAKELEETALKDPYFVERKLYPNVDFYSGIIYKALNIPTNMFTVMFALGRLPGWLAQFKEMVDAGGAKIGRPRQIYTGPTKTAYVPITKR